MFKFRMVKNHQYYAENTAYGIYTVHGALMAAI